MKRFFPASARMAVFAIMMMFYFLAYAALQDQSRKDLDAIQGTWVGQQWINAGISASPQKLSKLVFTIKGDQLTHMGEEGSPATIKLDTAKSPFSIDFIDKNKSVEYGIYKLDHGTLTFCIALSESAKDRPTVFESTSLNGFMLVVLKRQSSK